MRPDLARAALFFLQTADVKVKDVPLLQEVIKGLMEDANPQPDGSAEAQDGAVPVDAPAAGSDVDRRRKHRADAKGRK